MAEPACAVFLTISAFAIVSAGWAAPGPLLRLRKTAPPCWTAVLFAKTARESATLALKPLSLRLKRRPGCQRTAPHIP